MLFYGSKGEQPVAAILGAPKSTILSARDPHSGQDLALLNVTERLRYGDFVWNDSGAGEGRLWIRVDRKTQLVSVFRGRLEIGTAVMLYGAPDKPTPAGEFPILAKFEQHRSSIYGSDMPFTLRLTDDGVSIHASDVRDAAATHGCIGLPPEFAEHLFKAARIGDRVLIV